MQNHILLGSADAYLAEIGGDQLVGSGFENEAPEPGFYPDSIEVATPQRRA